MYTVDVSAVETGEAGMTSGEGIEMEFGENVIFESDGDCEVCREVQELVRDFRLEDKVEFYSGGLISLHPEHEAILVELAMQDMMMPVGVFSGKIIGSENIVEELTNLCVSEYEKIVD